MLSNYTSVTLPVLKDKKENDEVRRAILDLLSIINKLVEEINKKQDKTP